MPLKLFDVAMSLKDLEGRKYIGQQIPHEISIKMAIDSHGFIYRTSDLLFKDIVST